MLFQNDERYRNDERYLKLWMRYVSDEVGAIGTQQRHVVGCYLVVVIQ